jgi:hypothetical protein
MTSNERVDRHAIEISADAGQVFARLTDVSRWSEMFEPTIHGCELSRRDGVQTIQLWATANGEPRTWVSKRSIDEENRTIAFAQSVTSLPVAAMSGEWTVTPKGAKGSIVELIHTYRAEDDAAESLEWIARAVDTNSRKELVALKAACESEQDGAGAPFTFSDHIDADADPGLVFSFLDRGEHWARRLDHVAEAEMTEFPGGLQFLRMRTRTPDDNTHLTESFRLSQAPAVLLYKQTTLPRLLALHTGRWTITPCGEKWRVTSTHTVAIRADVVEDVLGPGATISDARALVRENLGNNSRLTLAAAVRWATDQAARR